LGTLRRGWIAHRWLGYAVSALLLGSVAVAFMVLRASPPRPTKPVVAVKRRPADTGAVVAPAVPAADGAGVELDAAPAADGAGLDIDATPSRRPTPKRSLNNRRRGNSKKRPARRRGILPPHRLGHLDINSVPWAHVYIGRRYAGETPAQGIALSPGRHTVRLVNPSHGISKTIVVRIVAGQHVRKVVRLER